MPNAEFFWPWDWNPASNLQQLAMCMCMHACAAICVLFWAGDYLAHSPSSSPSPLLPTFSQAQITHTFTHIPLNQPHSFKSRNTPWGSLSQTHLHIGPADLPCTQPQQYRSTMHTATIVSLILQSSPRQPFTPQQPQRGSKPLPPIGKDR